MPPRAALSAFAALWTLAKIADEGVNSVSTLTCLPHRTASWSPCTTG
jgi:hypothetical protein